MDCGWKYALSVCVYPFLVFDLIKVLLAAILGAVFVGVGVGLGVRAGGAPSGDDALAMSLSRVLHWPIERGYLITDLTVLALSVTYIDLPRLLCSLLTVLLSGKIIGIVQRGLRPSS